MSRILESSSTELCRACMKSGTGMKCIFNSEVNSVPVSQMLSFATPLIIRPDDELPNTLCPKCLQLLISFYKFQQMCIESDEKFREKPKVLPTISKKVPTYKCQPTKLQPPPPPPPPPDDYMIGQEEVQLNWNSCDSVPVVEVSDDEEVVLKFECDNELFVATEDDDGFDGIDEYEQFDKLPIIDVRFDDKPRKMSSGETGDKSDEEVVLFTINAGDSTIETYNCKLCRYVFDRQDLLDKHLKTHFLPQIKPMTTTLPSTSKSLIKGNGPIKLAYICNICKMAFGGQDRLAMHKKTHDKQGLSRSEITRQNKSSYSFECRTCEKFYNNHESFDRHTCVPIIHSTKDSLSKNNSFEDQRLYTCNICKKAFQTWEELTQHISEHQIKILYGSDPSSNTTVNVNVNIQTDKTHECEICKKTFSSWDEFKLHWQQHKENQRGPDTSTQSNGVTVSSSSEDQPVVTEANEPEAAVKDEITVSSEDTVKVCSQHVCNLCGKVFSGFLYLKRHMKFKHKRKHNSDENELKELNPLDALRAYRILRLYECGICGKTFDRQGHLLRHKKTHRKKIALVKHKVEESDREPETDKPYQCDVCGIFVCSGQNLRRHMKRIHEIGEDQVKQEKKRKGFSDTEEIFACIVCDEELLSRRALIQHLAKHKKEKNKEKEKENENQAEEEGEEDKQEDNENKETEDDNRRITRGKASIDKEKPHECSCGKVFKNVGHRDQHMLIHQLQSGIDQTETKCKHCDRQFKTSHHLLQHMIIHKMFKCTTCGESFSRSENLIRHSKTHSNTVASVTVTKNDLLKCNVCKKKLKCKSSKIRHMRNVHAVNITYPTEAEKNIMYNCVSCEKSFAKIESLKDHKNCHKNPKKEERAASQFTILPYTDPHRCLECRLVVSTRGCLRKHIHRKHKHVFHPINPKKHKVQCACTRPFDSEGNLMKHIRAHIVKPNVGEKYACHFCFIDRPHAWQIRRHLKDSHAVTTQELKDIKWNLCNGCNTNFINSKELKRHVKINHGKKDDVHSKIVFKCQSCDKCYLKKEQMLKHVETHKDQQKEGEEKQPDFIQEKWPTCKICNKAFAKTYRMRRHMENVHNMKMKEEDIDNDLN